MYHRTAISRKTASLPSRWLTSEAGPLGQPLSRMIYDLGIVKVLDYGCGRGTDCDHYGWDGWDPNTDRVEHSVTPTDLYEVVVSTYVANVIPPEGIYMYLAKVRQCLTTGGIAYISVRDDIPDHIEGSGQWTHNLELWGCKRLHHKKGAFTVYTLQG